MDASLKGMREVSGTMLITLYARARETLSKEPIIEDRKAVEMIELIKAELAGSRDPIHRKILKGSYNSKLAVTMALRSRRFDRYVLAFLEAHPAGTVINFGCGLDTRFERIDNEQVTWFDIDFPEVIELRRRYMAEGPRHRFLAGSILDPAWIGEVKTKGPFFFIAEGVFMYLGEEDVKGLLAMIAANFPGSELACENTNRFWVDRMKSRYLQFKFRHQLGMTGGATFTFGIPDSRYFEGWDPRYEFLDDWTYFDEGERKLGWLNAFSRIELFRKVQWTVHYRIN